MRFIIGLLIGAAITLFIASGLQAGQPVWQTSLAKLQSWQGRITGDAAQPGAPAALATNEPAAADDGEDIDPTFVEPTATRESMREPPIETLDTFPPAQPYPAVDLTGEPALADEATHASPPAAQQVWTPFYSEASAKGFAAQLSNTLQRTFNVQKKSAAQYVIVFSSNSAAETEAVHTQIADLFGEAGEP